MFEKEKASMFKTQSGARKAAQRGEHASYTDLFSGIPYDPLGPPRVIKKKKNKLKRK